MSRQKPPYAAKIYTGIFPRTIIRSEKPKIFTRAKLEEIYLMRPSQKYEWIKNSHFAVIKELSRTQVQFCKSIPHKKDFHYRWPR